MFKFLALKSVFSLVSASLLLTAVAGVEGGTIFMDRSRTAESLESFQSFLSVSYNVTDLTNGATSVARFESPQGEVFMIQGSAGRGSTYSFGKIFPHESLAAAAGVWKITIVDGTRTDEDIRIVLPTLAPTDFPAYRPFPTFSYQENPQKVFLPKILGTNHGASISGISGSRYDFEALGSVYTVPNGGPYTAKTSDYLSRPAIAIVDSAGQALSSIIPQLRSYSIARFHIGPGLPFAGHCGLAEDQVEFTATGLIVGDSYEFFGSTDLATWESIQSFVAISNAHGYWEPRREGSRFFQMIHVN